MIDFKIVCYLKSVNLQSNNINILYNLLYKQPLGWF